MNPRKRETEGTPLGELKGDVLWALENPIMRLGGLNAGTRSISSGRQYNKKVIKGHARATHHKLKSAHRWTVQDNLMEAVGRFFSKSNAKQFTNNIFNSRPPFDNMWIEWNQDAFLRGFAPNGKQEGAHFDFEGSLWDENIRKDLVQETKQKWIEQNGDAPLPQRIVGCHIHKRSLVDEVWVEDGRTYKLGTAKAREGFCYSHQFFASNYDGLERLVKFGSRDDEEWGAKICDVYPMQISTSLFNEEEESRKIFITKDEDFQEQMRVKNRFMPENSLSLICFGKTDYQPDTSFVFGVPTNKPRLIRKDSPINEFGHFDEFIDTVEDSLCCAFSDFYYPDIADSSQLAGIENQRGLFGVVVALLSFINHPWTINETKVNKEEFKSINTRQVPFDSHITVNIDLPKEKVKDILKQKAIQRTRPYGVREHDVMGHRRVWTDKHGIQKETWVKPHVRGDAKLGRIYKDYNVVKNEKTLK